MLHTYHRVKHIPVFLCQLWFLTGQSNEAGHEIFITKPPICMHESWDCLRRKTTIAQRSEVFLNIGLNIPHPQPMLWNWWVRMTFTKYFFILSLRDIYWVSIMGMVFCFHSARLCLLVGAFNPFMFKVIIDKYDPVAIYFIVLGSSLYTLFVFPV